MTASPAGPERHYRRLLWAYPGPYRRRHGAEIVTTLLDMAESGHVFHRSENGVWLTAAVPAAFLHEKSD